MTKELGIWGLVGLGFLLSPLAVANTSLWQELLVALVEMGLVMRGRNLSPLCYPGAQLWRSGSSVLTPNQGISKLSRRGFWLLEVPSC